MEVIRPIPKSLLIHDAELLNERTGDWGSDGLDLMENLSSVRIEPSGKIVRDKNNTEVQLAALMFYDCRNSRPSNLTFEEDQIVKFDGRMYRITSVELLYDEKRLHHYEVGMVRYAGKSSSEDSKDSGDEQNTASW